MVKKQHIMSVEEQNALQWQVHEILLVIDNEQKYYNRKIAMFKNLFLKLQKGSFDKSIAPKLFSYLTDEAGRDYNKQYGGVDGNYKITPQARRIVDIRLVEEFLDAVKNKEYDFMGYVPKVR